MRDSVRLILLTFMACAIALATDQRRTIGPETAPDSRPTPRAFKSKRALHPLRLLRRLVEAESEFALKLSSRGIQQKVEVGKSEAMPRSTSLMHPSECPAYLAAGCPQQNGSGAAQEVGSGQSEIDAVEADEHKAHHESLGAKENCGCTTEKMGSGEGQEGRPNDYAATKVFGAQAWESSAEFSAMDLSGLI